MQRYNLNGGAFRTASQMLTVAALTLTLAMGGCHVNAVKTTASSASNAASSVSYPSVDAGLGEHLYPDEKPIAEELSVVIEESIRKQFSPGSARRDAHPKAHGCVKAEISILDTLPATLAKGMFVPGTTYQAWIRFSNGSGDPTRADIKRDARGMAIKVLGVPGKKLLDDESAATTQDFIMINHPVFFATDPARYRAFLQDGKSDHFYRDASNSFRSRRQGHVDRSRDAQFEDFKSLANPLLVHGSIPARHGLRASGGKILRPSMLKCCRSNPKTSRP